MRERRLPERECEEILRSVRPRIPELIARYEIPEEPVADMILASMDCLLREGHRSSDPGDFFLQVLEGYCESWVAAQEAREAEEAVQSAEETPG
jgi:hypothetical protein